MANKIDSFEQNLIAWLTANGWIMQSCTQVPQVSMVPAMAPQVGIVTTTNRNDTLIFSDGQGNTCTVLLGGSYQGI